jgi:hypothetical protein
MKEEAFPLRLSMKGELPNPYWKMATYLLNCLLE